jgi:hypothetical protein
MSETQFEHIFQRATEADQPYDYQRKLAIEGDTVLFAQHSDRAWKDRRRSARLALATTIR